MRFTIESLPASELEEMKASGEFDKVVAEFVASRMLKKSDELWRSSAFRRDLEVQVGQELNPSFVRFLQQGAVRRGGPPSRSMTRAVGSIKGVSLSHVAKRMDEQFGDHLTPAQGVSRKAARRALRVQIEHFLADELRRTKLFDFVSQYPTPPRFDKN